ncbi:hypothetical protein P691DRAFT_789730 [Macrolepiota fuliginosa MF-IS2]|uniref:Uncharacterized protein n=1 Tax=Macrolepiota fuliginosa MF-IS2 TaxID=1400762 RepID=A0A9P6BWV0_9AGAR|nr:hypothetical protein P691DRAFT_789730 [Macrolepiota fuliginosa MF-IS2]
MGVVQEVGSDVGSGSGPEYRERELGIAQKYNSIEGLVMLVGVAKPQTQRALDVWMQTNGNYKGLSNMYGNNQTPEVNCKLSSGIRFLINTINEERNQLGGDKGGRDRRAMRRGPQRAIDRVYWCFASDSVWGQLPEELDQGFTATFGRIIPPESYGSDDGLREFQSWLRSVGSAETLAVAKSGVFEVQCVPKVGGNSMPKDRKLTLTLEKLDIWSGFWLFEMARVRGVATTAATAGSKNENQESPLGVRLLHVDVEIV